MNIHDIGAYRNYGKAEKRYRLHEQVLYAYILNKIQMHVLDR